MQNHSDKKRIGLLGDLPKVTKKDRDWPWAIETSTNLYRENQKFPKISIVTPSYNQGEYIEETIRSVLLQNYPNLEYIIIDGGSTDNTVEIIKKYEKWLTYWVSEPDRGQSHAINKGFKMISGEITNWLNSDDLLAKNALFRISNIFKENPKAAMICATGYLLNIEGKLSEINLQHTDCESVRLGTSFFCQPSTFYRTYVFDKIGYLDEGLDYVMDYDFFSRINLNFAISTSEARVCVFRHHLQSKSMTSKKAFTIEHCQVYCRILRSFGVLGMENISKLRYIGLYKDESEQFSYCRDIAQDDISKSLYIFLNRQFSMVSVKMTAKEFKVLKKILKILKTEAPHIYMSLNKRNRLKVRFLENWQINFHRFIKRKFFKIKILDL